MVLMCQQLTDSYCFQPLILVRDQKVRNLKKNSTGWLVEIVHSGNWDYRKSHLATADVS